MTANRTAKLCRYCGQPMRPKGVRKRPNEYDHAQGCPYARTKQKPDNPTDWKAWKWKAAAFRRCLSLCKTEASAKRFIAKEFAGIYEVGLIHGRCGTGFMDRGEPEKQKPCADCGSPTLAGCACG